MKYILFSTLFLFSTLSQAWTQTPPKPIQECVSQAPYGFPQVYKQKVIGICRHAYVTAYDPAARLPAWTSYTLLPGNALGCIPRSNAFAADASLPKGNRAELADYAGSGYDMGHVAPDGDMSFDLQAELESFILTNMTPQAPSINRGGWKLLETAVRGWAFQLNQPFTIYAGPIYSDQNKTIGPNKVVVPHGYFKIVINNATKEVAAWVFPNQGSVGNDLSKLRTPVAQVEQTAGIKFPLPQNARELTAPWPVNFGQLTNSKRAKCGKSDE